MAIRHQNRLRLFILFGFIFVIVLVALISLRFGQAGQTAQAPPASTATITNAPPLPQQPARQPSSETTPSMSDKKSATPPTEPLPQPLDSKALNGVSLIIPVAGVRREQLIDTFDAARSNGRVHDAIDIPAPHNTAVLAATDGAIIKLFQSQLGGTAIYQLSPNHNVVYYYAHLDHYADGLAEGNVAHQGDVIGYVGDTGNAGSGNYHLHFAIWLITDPKHYWNGENVNPYPLLRGTH